METKLYVGNLPFATTEEELRALFEQAGSVISVEVIRDKRTGRSKGFGFIQMSNQEETDKAASMFANYSLGERTIKVGPARPREEKSYGGYGHRTDKQTRGGSRRGGGQRRQ